ncbi:hypothetical protein LXL04_026134 [Taraxacum kok-saghyz]
MLALTISLKGIRRSHSLPAPRNEKTPVDWWDSYGAETPELRNFAMRILSLTCSSSGCERNWSAFEMVHSKKRNRLQQKRMNDLVYVMYNLKLTRKEEKKGKVCDVAGLDTLDLDDVSSDDEWITEEETFNHPTDEEWMNLFDGPSSSQPQATRDQMRGGIDLGEDANFDLQGRDDMDASFVMLD